MIDFDLLCGDGLLTQDEFSEIDWGGDPHSVDYGKLYLNRPAVLRAACSRFEKDDEYAEFCAENAFWLDDYALFMALKHSFGG